MQRLFPEQHFHSLFRQAHALEQQALAGYRPQVADGHQRIFQVVEQSAAKSEVEFPKPADFAVFRIPNVETDIREALPRLRHIFVAGVEAPDREAALRQGCREEAHAAAGIHA